MGFVPRERGRIVDGADTWKIDAVDVATLATRYVCDATKVRFCAALHTRLRGSRAQHARERDRRHRGCEDCRARARRRPDPRELEGAHAAGGRRAAADRRQRAEAAEVEYLTNEHNLHSFDGQVTAVTTGGEFLADADDEPGQWLVAIANEFEKWATWLATVTNFHDVRLLELQQYQRTAAGKTLDYSTLKFRIETKEPKP
jgi:hypothetical protein